MSNEEKTPNVLHPGILVTSFLMRILESWGEKKSSKYPLNRRLLGPQGQSGEASEKERYFASTRIRTKIRRSATCKVVTVLTGYVICLNLELLLNWNTQ
jgi:hypothetical protein